MATEGLTYDRQTVLSHQLRGKLGLKRLTRKELFSRLQLIRTVEPITQQAYVKVEDEMWRGNEGNSPHGNPWHVSFHASQFPGSDMSCPRAGLYGMMDFPDSMPTDRRLRVLAAAGKGIEEELVRTWHRAGILISASPDEPVQTGFEHPDVWLTGSVDAIIKPEGWNKPLPVEIKSKYQRVIDEMRVGKRGPDPGHISQIKVQLSLVRMTQEKIFPELEPVTHGIIYYLSRDKPDETAEFRVDLDDRFFELGIARLKQWKAWFEESYLPSVNPSKKHPMGWRWSYQPCLYCPYKKTCQLDHQEGRTDLMDSIGIDRSQKVRPEYDPVAARQRVLNRWSKRSGDDKITVVSQPATATESN